MSEWLELLLIIMIGAFAGGAAYFLISKQHPKNSSAKNNTLPHQYFTGLNYLINEQPDKAVDIFAKMIVTDSDTVETHLAIGALFRRRGEVDRAIRIHQNLIARPQLSKSQHSTALLALGQDYLSAGMFDRAEEIFLKLFYSREQLDQALKYLLEIYQHQKDWKNAIIIARHLEQTGRTSCKKIIAHFYCELSELALAQNQIRKAKHFARAALTHHAEFGRAELLLAEIAVKSHEYREAIKILTNLQKNYSDLIADSLQLLSFCYEQLGGESDLVLYLETLLENTTNPSALFAIFEKLRQLMTHQPEHLYQCLAKLSTRPNWMQLAKLLHWQLIEQESMSSPLHTHISTLVKQLMHTQAHFRCNRCGFNSNQRLWHCPSCKQWGVIESIYDEEAQIYGKPSYQPTE